MARIKRLVQDRREAYYHERVKQAGSRYAGFDWLSCQITLDVLYTYDVLHQLIARYMTTFGLSKSTLNILMLLRHGPAEGMQLHDLGELLLVSRANITGLIDHLEQKGYVKRIVDRSDRRARYARITKKAEMLLDDFMPLHYQNVKTLLKDMSNGEKEALLALLEKMRTSLTANSEACESRLDCVSHG
ncbi:MAG: MarR family transcriptional regulator [Acidobacteria bacterium]|nr:MarR family transcriptional regulator [Acidobacteriota bacterium]